MLFLLAATIRGFLPGSARAEAEAYATQAPAKMFASGRAFDGEVLELEGVLQEVLELHPRALTAKAELKGARAEFVSSFSGLLPRATLSSARSRYIDAGEVPEGAWQPSYSRGDEVRSYSLSLNQTLFGGGSGISGAAAGYSGLRAARERYRAALAELCSEVRNTYLDWRVAGEESAIARSGREFADRQLQRARQQEELGLASRVDRLFFENSLAQAEIRLEDALIGTATARRSLESFMQMELAPGILPQAVEDLLDGAGLGEAGTAGEDLAGDAPESAFPAVETARWQARGARWSALAASGSLLPRLSASLNWTNSHSDLFTYDRRFTNRTVGLSLSWNLFRGGGGLADSWAAWSTRRSLERMLQSTRLSLRSEWRVAGERLAGASRKVDLAERSWRIASRNLELLDQKYSLGLIDATDLLDGEQRLREARGALLAARAGLLRAHWAREALLGRYPGSDPREAP